MKHFNVPEINQVPEENAKTLESLKKSLGFVPNVYAFLANSAYGMPAYLELTKKKLAFTPKEKEVISLTASEIRKCKYCLSAHTQTAKKSGFTDEQIIEIRKGEISFNPKFASLAEMTKSIINHNGNVDAQTIDNFYDNGYTDAQLVDLTIAIAIISITNYLNNVTKIPVDFPLASDI